MSILKSVQDYLSTYGGMELTPITTDQTKEDSGYALAPTGNQAVSRDILGNVIYENDYVFHAKESALNEVDRQDSYDFLEGLFNWLEGQSDAGNLPDLPGSYKAESLTVANAMLFDIAEDGTGLYQVQIKLKIRKERTQ